MAFTTQMVNLLKSNASVRHELMALKLAQNAEKRAAGVIRGVKPTKEAKQVVSFLEKEEKRVLNSKEARQAFDQVVKPEARYAATEDCFNRGYMLEDSFWNDSHNKEMTQHAKHGYYEGIYANRIIPMWRWDEPCIARDMHNLCSKNGIREFVKEMLNIRKAQGEVPSVISQKDLRIDLPLPKPPKSASGKIKNEVSIAVNEKHPRVVKSDKLESVDPNMIKTYKGS